MSVTAVVVGVVFLAVAPVLVRFRDAIARWQIDGAVQTLRRSSLSNSEYVDERVQSLRKPGSFRLQRLIVVAFAIFIAFAGAYAIARGVGFGS